MNISKTDRLLWIVVFAVLHCQIFGLLSDYKLCGDPECERFMSRVQAIRDYRGKDCRFLSFRRGEIITVYHKLTGRREDLWAGSIDKQFGYFPSDAVRVEQVYAKTEITLETQESDFFCIDETGHPIDSSFPDPDDDDDKDHKVPKHKSDHSDPQDSLTPQSTESTFKVQENIEGQKGLSDGTELQEELYETSEKEQGGSPSSSWLYSSVTGLLDFNKEEQLGYVEKGEKEEKPKPNSLRPSTMSGWLEFGGNANRDDREESRDINEGSFTSSVTGWFGYGNDKRSTEVESTDEAHEDKTFRSRRMSLDLEGSEAGEKKEMGTLGWLGSGLSSTLGFGLSSEEPERGRSGEGEEKEKTGPASWMDIGIGGILGFKSDKSVTDEPKKDVTRTEDGQTLLEIDELQNVDSSQPQAALTADKRTETVINSQMKEPTSTPSVEPMLSGGTDDMNAADSHLFAEPAVKDDTADVFPEAIAELVKVENKETSVEIGGEDSVIPHININESSPMEPGHKEMNSKTESEDLTAQTDASLESEQDFGEVNSKFFMRTEGGIRKDEEEESQAKEGIEEEKPENKIQINVFDESSGKSGKDGTGHDLQTEERFHDAVSPTEGEAGDIEERRVRDDEETDTDPSMLHDTSQEEMDEHVAGQDSSVSPTSGNYSKARDFVENNEEVDQHYGKPELEEKNQTAEDWDSSYSDGNPVDEGLISLNETTSTIIHGSLEQARRAEREVLNNEAYYKSTTDSEAEVKETEMSEKEEKDDRTMVKEGEKRENLKQNEIKQELNNLKEDVGEVKEQEHSEKILKNTMEIETSTEGRPKEVEIEFRESQRETKEPDQNQLNVMLEQMKQLSLAEEMQDKFEGKDEQEKGMLENKIKGRQSDEKEMDVLKEKRPEREIELKEENQEEEERLQREEQLEGTEEGVKKFGTLEELLENVEDVNKNHLQEAEEKVQKLKGEDTDEPVEMETKTEDMEFQEVNQEDKSVTEKHSDVIPEQETQINLKEELKKDMEETDPKAEQIVEDRIEEPPKAEDKDVSEEMETRDGDIEFKEARLQEEEELKKEQQPEAVVTQEEEISMEDINEEIQSHEETNDNLSESMVTKTASEIKKNLNVENGVNEKDLEKTEELQRNFKDRSSIDFEHSLENVRDAAVAGADGSDSEDGGHSSEIRASENISTEQQITDSLMKETEVSSVGVEILKHKQVVSSQMTDSPQIQPQTSALHVSEEVPESSDPPAELESHSTEALSLLKNTFGFFSQTSTSESPELQNKPVDEELNSAAASRQDRDMSTASLGGLSEPPTPSTEPVLHSVPNTEAPPRSKITRKHHKSLLLHLSLDETHILMEVLGQHKLQFLNYILTGSEPVITEDDQSILLDIEGVLHYHRESLTQRGMKNTDLPEEDKEKTITLEAIEKLEMLLKTVRETFTTGISEVSNNQAEPKCATCSRGDEETEEASKDPSIPAEGEKKETENNPAAGWSVTDGSYKDKTRTDEEIKESQTSNSEQKWIKETLDFVSWVVKEFPIFVHHILKWIVVQVVSSLPEDIRPGPDLYGVPWEPIIITCLIGLVTFLMFTRRCYTSIQSRMYQRAERRMAEQVAQLVEEKGKVLETLSQCQQEYDEVENSLRDSGILAQAPKKEQLELQTRQLEQFRKDLGRDLEQLKDQLDQQRDHRKEQERRISEIEESIRAFEEETKELQSQEEQAQTTLKIYSMNSERLQRNLEMAQKENTVLQENNVHLKQESEGWAERVSELEAEMRRCEIANDVMMQDVATKDERIMSLTDRLLKMKGWDSDLAEEDGGEGRELEAANGTAGGEEGSRRVDSSDTHVQKVQKLIYAAKLNADLKSVDEDKDRVFAKLNDEIKAKEDLEVSIKEMETEKLSLQSDSEHYSSQVQRLNQKLQIMTEMYQENELKLHRMLTVEEKERVQKEEKLNKADKNIAMAIEELNNYRKRAEEIEEELEKTKQSYQTQISAQETKAHNNWLAFRAAERELADIRRENALFRQKLTDTQFKLDSLEKDSLALSSLARPLPFRAERSPYIPSPLGRPSSETRAFLSPPTLLDGPPARLSPRARGLVEPPGGPGEVEYSGGHSDSGSISPTWERDRRGPPPGPPGPLGPPGYMFPEPGAPIFRRPHPPPGALGPLPPPGPLPPGPFPLRGLPPGPPHPSDMADGSFRENRLGPGEQEHKPSGPADRRTPPEMDQRLGGPPLRPPMGQMDGPFPGRAPYGPLPPPDFYAPRIPGSPSMRPMWPRPLPPQGMMPPPRFPPGGPYPNMPRYNPSMGPPPADGPPPSSMGPPPPHSQPPAENKPSAEDLI